VSSVLFTIEVCEWNGVIVDRNLGIGLVRIKMGEASLEVERGKRKGLLGMSAFLFPG
jgi:hypothetical protein